MFTILSIACVAGLALAASRAEKRAAFDAAYPKQARQDLRLIAYLLAAILVMLGVIADRLH